MARRSRVELNRAALDTVRRGLADGVFDLAVAVRAEAERRAPDAPPTGEGLVASGGAAVWTDGRKTHESGSGTVERPRELRTGAGRITAAVGFTFPGRFQETGTVHHAAQPFLTPAAAEVLGSDAQVILSKAMARRLGGGAGGRG